MAAFPSPLQKTDTSYLEDAQAYDNILLDQWPRSSNVFIQRTASNIRPGVQIRSLTVTSFTELCGCMLASRPGTAFTFALDLSSYGSERVVSAHLLSITQGLQAPLTADNAGFLPFAMEWFSKDRPAITVTVSDMALFWAHAGSIAHG
ncbi:MAG: hypothetical protein CMK74_03600 [Pseudomonadales bacterium]|nr:hypothetical protein [Pseudomonadales bacterium]|tara:strand:- start:213 stop:656 length:444 start_codon:yes stop_codon:yes gene_type:complete